MNQLPALERHPAPAMPHMARIHYPRVVLQLFWRMRIDLLVMVLLCLLLHLVCPLDVDNALVTSGSQATLGIAVSVFLAFRNTQAINRWWEARSLWGGVVNQSRTWRDTLLAELPLAQVSAPAVHAPESQRLLQLQVLLVWLLNFELRGHGPRELRQRVLALAAGLGFAADVTLQQACCERALELNRLLAHNLVSDLGKDALLRSLAAFHDAAGGLQKIRNTPIPVPYDAFVRLIAWLYGAELFINLHDSGKPWVGAVVFFGFLVAERIAAYVEGPFDWDPPSFSLPLNQICLGISDDLLGADSPFAAAPRCYDPSIWT